MTEETTKPAAQPTAFGSWVGPIGLAIVLLGLAALSYSVLKGPASPFLAWPTTSPCKPA